MVNRAGVLLLVLLFIPILICADSISSSISCKGVSFVGSSVVQPGAAWSERLSVSDVGMIVRDLFTGEKAGANTMVRSQGPMGIYEYSASALNSTGKDGVCLFGMPENRSVSGYESTVLGLMQQGSYSSMLLHGNGSRFLINANGSGILLTRAGSVDGLKEMYHASDVLGELNLTEVMEIGVYDWF